MNSIDEVDLITEFRCTTTDRKGSQRDLHVVVGKEYRVVPTNPKATKNRGRICTVESIIGWLSKHTDVGFAIVRFHDTKRSATVKCESLVEV